MAAARDALGGTVDVDCANAGLASPGDAFADEEVWAAAWDVNVMAHVRAARALLPQWLERGSGRFVTTASAAGLLTMIGAAPYSVTKHGAVAFAEWLSLTYRHRGVKVHAICPQGVRRIRSPPRVRRRAGPRPRSHRAGRRRRRAVRRDGGRPSWSCRTPRSPVTTWARAEDPDRWMGNMNRLQQKWKASGA
ncbi:SDR family oxidoreductase OS=Streptomyces microflavus OX=1919 GN=G3I39_16890 PE=3 SV=1 [Streptomyces microflavus]